MVPLDSVIPGDCMEIHAGKHLDFWHIIRIMHSQSFTLFLSLKKTCQSFHLHISLITSIYFQVWVCVFSTNSCLATFLKILVAFFAFIFPIANLKASVDSYAEVDMVGWSLEPQKSEGKGSSRMALEVWRENFIQPK